MTPDKPILTSTDIRQRFLSYFEKRGHVLLPSAPLLPENDPSVLFNTAGMQPLVPYLLGAPHPSGSLRLASVQKCVRTNDIEEVGDNTHLTFFEMLGNWSLGDYFKKEALQWSYEFLTSREEGLGLDVRRLYVTVFEGDENAPKDTEAYAIWEKIFREAGLDPEKRIFYMDKSSNWWSAGDNGPSGPDSEMFYDVSGTLTEGLSREEFIAADERQDVVEIWNDVFMEYRTENGAVVEKLSAQNVDTGTGLERAVTVAQGKRNVYETDLFQPILAAIASRTSSPNDRAARIIADHLRAVTFLIGDGAMPSNTDQGYIVRRLLRRSVRLADRLGMPAGSLAEIAGGIIEQYRIPYPVLGEKSEQIVAAVAAEEEKFRRTLERGMRELEKRLSKGALSGKDAFDLFTTYGFPVELTEEIAREKGQSVDKEEFERVFKEHQDLSRTASAGKFKGGLAGDSPKITALHTSTHLMLAALRKELGTNVHQAGSNITEERTRFDFTYPEKVSREVLDRVEAYVNEAIQASAEVKTVVMPKAEAQAAGVEGSFWEKYPEAVTVYQVEGPDGTVYSRELCGGPHVKNTSDIAVFGRFRIAKEEASSAGVRRVKGVLESAG